MAQPSRHRALPGGPLSTTEEGASTGLTTRIVLVGTVVLGQLWALTVALEASLSDHDRQATLLAAFSLLSFVLVLVLALLEPAPRQDRLRGRAGTEAGGYIPPPVAPARSTGGPRPKREAGATGR